METLPSPSWANVWSPLGLSASQGSLHGYRGQFGSSQSRLLRLQAANQVISKYALTSCRQKPAFFVFFPKSIIHLRWILTSTMNMSSAPLSKYILLSLLLTHSDFCWVQTAFRPYRTMKTSASVPAANTSLVKILISYGTTAKWQKIIWKEWDPDQSVLCALLQTYRVCKTVSVAG